MVVSETVLGFLEGEAMAIVRWSEWNPFKELERLVEDFFPRRVLSERMFEARFPVLDVEDAGDAIKVTAELPGIEPKDVKVELHGDVLTIRGEKKEEHEERDEKRRFYFRERVFGSFSRAVQLPEEVDPESVEATFEHGLLTVMLKKSDAKKRREIPIKVKKK